MCTFNGDSYRVPGKIHQFITDLHSGKLHRDFHNPTHAVRKCASVVGGVKHMVYIHFIGQSKSTSNV